MVLQRGKSLQMAAALQLFSDSCSNSKRFGARIADKLNRKFVQTDDTTHDSEETGCNMQLSL